MKIAVLFFFTASISLAWTNNEACSVRKLEIINDYSIQADQAIQSLVRQLESRQPEVSAFYKYTPLPSVLSKYHRIQRAINTLKCAQHNLKQAWYVCGHDDGKYIASTSPFGNGVRINEKLFFRAKPLLAISTLVHEATHKCGTTDVAYFHNENPRDVGLVPWDAIADTYSAWIEGGFCIPGEDC